MEHQRCHDLRDIRDARLASVERDAGVEVFAETNRKLIYHPAAEAETDRSEFLVAVRSRFEPHRGRDEILGHLFAIDRSKGGGPFLFVAGITADRSQSVRGE